MSSSKLKFNNYTNYDKKYYGERDIKK